MSDPLYSGPAPPQTPEPIEASPDHRADLLVHVRLLQEALDATAPTEAALLRADRQIAALQNQVDRLSQQIVTGQRQVEALERQMADLRGSLSWRLTAPLRAAARPVLRILRAMLSRAS